MNKNLMFFYFFGFILLAQISLAQSKNEIGVEEVQVTESFIPIVPEANKFSELPLLRDTIKVSKNVYYSPINKRFETQLKLDPINSAKIKGEPLSKLYQTYIYGGLGNTSLPYSKIFYSSDRNKSLSYGLALGYVESYAKVKSVFDQEKKVSAASRKTDFAAFVKKDFHSGIFNANISRQGNIFQAYGYDLDLVSNEKFTQEYWGYSTLRLSFIRNNLDRNKLSYSAKIFAYDLNEQTENSISLILSGRKIVGLNSFNLDFGLDYILNNHSRKYVFDDKLSKELILLLSPSVKRKIFGGNLNVGFKLNAMNNRGSTNSNYVIFPNVNYNYIFSENNLSAKIGVRGGLDKNSYYSLSQRNPFILNALKTDGGSLNLVNTQTKYDFFIGIDSYLGAEINSFLQFSYARVHNMPFFELDDNSTYSNKFLVIYDNVNHFSLNSEIDWAMNTNSKFSLKLDYHNYDLDSLIDYAYKPTIISKLGFLYNIGDKIIPKIELVCFIDRSSVEDSGWSNSPVLNDIVDIDFALEYKYNTIFSAYFELKNLIGNYQIWENYPVLGPQVFFGLSYRL